MEITLRPVTRQNFAAVIAAKVAPDQQNFVAPNVYSLAEAAVESAWTPVAICAGETVVGFAMFGQGGESGRWWIMRFMIGFEQQGKGYGTAALRGLLDVMIERHGPAAIFLGYEPDNVVAARLYARAGFVPTGEVEHGEIIARLDVG